MKTIGILMFIILAILLIFNSSEDTQEDQTSPAPIQTTEKPHFDTPAHTYKKQVEALSISNTLQTPVSTYLNSRVDARNMAKESLKEGNKRIEEQDKAMEALTK